MDKKYCGKCENTLPKAEFGKNKSRYDGLQGYCKVCMKEVRNKHYERNKKPYKQRAKSRTQFIKNFVFRFKSRCCCKICGENRAWVLDFHHNDRKNKHLAIGTMIIRGFSISKIKEEIRKCDVVCANCHRDLHYKERIKK